jgi:type I restriction enzyme R subunit
VLESFFVERMDQNEEIFVRFMNDSAFQNVVTAWLASEAYQRLRGQPSWWEKYGSLQTRQRD